MPKFGRASQKRLKTLDSRLQQILNEAIQYIDFSITFGYRGKAAQNKMFKEDKSKLKFPFSKHNKKPSLAVDVAPYGKCGINWDNIKSFYFLAGVIFIIAKQLDIEIRWGGNWKRLWLLKKQKFDDLVHFELLE